MHMVDLHSPYKVCKGYVAMVVVAAWLGRSHCGNVKVQ